MALQTSHYNERKTSVRKDATIRSGWKAGLRGFFNQPEADISKPVYKLARRGKKRPDVRLFMIVLRRGGPSPLPLFATPANQGGVLWKTYRWNSGEIQQAALS